MTLLNLNEDLKNEFLTQFKTPINDLVNLNLIQNPCLSSIYSDEAKAVKNNHRNIILQQGRANFDIDSDGLTALQKVDLYCFYYFQMHFTSSYIFYLNEKEFLSSQIKQKNVWFIDIGCGPFTSGFAFNSWVSKIENSGTKSINYIGIDTSQSMLNKAIKVKGKLKKDNYLNCLFTTDKFEAIDNLRNLAGAPEDLLIILNYSYLFASHSLVVDDFINFTNELINGCYVLDKSRLVIMQQNPKTDSLNNKWNLYKEMLSNLHSYETYPKLYGFKFKDALESSNYPQPTFNVKCDILKSFL